ncbi:MAG: hypothetical protein SPI15_09970, partial [Candidatus Faecousia sp.]|nr:hypothetical protein [Candidatus Faecousia sp.]
DKSVFERVRCRLPVIAKPVRRLVVAIPRLEGKCAEKRHKKRELLRFWAEIVSWFLSTGGLPRRCAPRNDSIFSALQTPICLTAVLT